MISHTRQGVRFVSGIGFCFLGFHTRDRRYDLLRALGSASGDHERHRGYDLLRALGSLFCDITHETGGTICYGHWVLHLGISHTRQGYDLLRALGSASCDITHEPTDREYNYVLHVVISHTRQGGTTCYGHWVLHLVISHMNQQTGSTIVFCTL